MVLEDAMCMNGYCYLRSGWCISSIYIYTLDFFLIQHSTIQYYITDCITLVRIQFYNLQHDMHQWLLIQFYVLLMMDAESVRNIQSDLAVTKKQYCQSCILLALYIMQTYDARKLKHKISSVYTYANGSYNKGRLCSL